MANIRSDQKETDRYGNNEGNGKRLDVKLNEQWPGGTNYERRKVNEERGTGK